MVRELFGLIPDTLARFPASTAWACCALGAVLYLVGARFSRSILALVAVAIGTCIGMKLPAWRGWQVDGMGVAVAAAIVLGAAAFVFHRTCIGLVLGAVMSGWAGAVVWIARAAGAKWDLHDVKWHGDLVQLLRDSWQTLPPQLSRIFPAVCLCGLAAGISISVVLPKLAKVLTHSLVGVTLMLVMGMVAIQSTHPDWLDRVPGTAAAQWGALLLLVVLSAVWQWQITPPGRKLAARKESKA